MPVLVLMRRIITIRCGRLLVISCKEVDGRVGVEVLGSMCLYIKTRRSSLNENHGYAFPINGHTTVASARLGSRSRVNDRERYIIYNIPA